MDFIDLFLFVIVPIGFVIALYGALKPYLWRLSGRKQQLEKQEEQNRLIREQNRLMNDLLKKENEPRAL